MNLGELFSAVLIVVFLVLLVRLLTRRSREDAKILLRADHFSRQRSPTANAGGRLSTILKRALEPEDDTSDTPPRLTPIQMIRLARELTPEVRRLVKEGRKPEAVRLVRERTGMDEHTAQQIVDKLG